MFPAANSAAVMGTYPCLAIPSSSRLTWSGVRSILAIRFFWIRWYMITGIRPSSFAFTCRAKSGVAVIGGSGAPLGSSGSGLRVGAPNDVAKTPHLQSDVYATRPPEPQIPHRRALSVRTTDPSPEGLVRQSHRSLTGGPCPSEPQIPHRRALSVRTTDPSPEGL